MARNKWLLIAFDGHYESVNIIAGNIELAVKGDVDFGAERMINFIYFAINDPNERSFAIMLHDEFDVFFQAPAILVDKMRMRYADISEMPRFMCGLGDF